jgi:hypothetical protein
MDDSNRETILQQNSVLISNINNLKLEYNQLSYYIEKCELNGASETILPNIYAIYNVNSDGSIYIKEEPLDDYYIFNIDKDQGCTIDTSKLPKILHTIKYSLIVIGSAAQQAIDSYRLFANSLGPAEITETQKFNVKTDTSGLEITYTIKPDALEQEISSLSSLYSSEDLNWGFLQTREFERTFYLNGNGNRGNIVRAIYTYKIPTVIKFDPSTNQTVDELFNLDNNNEIHMEFRKIPRNLRNVDNIFDLYVPNVEGFLTKAIRPSPGGEVDDNLRIWKAIYAKTGLPAPLPDNFKWMNLMKYLAFYNNYLLSNYGLDLNQNLDLVRCRDELELIPYDYS